MRFRLCCSLPGQNEPRPGSMKFTARNHPQTPENSAVARECARYSELPARDGRLGRPKNST